MNRVRRRYLGLEVEGYEGVDTREFMDAVWGVVVRLFGEYGASKSGLCLIDYNVEENFVILRASHVCVDMVRAALALLTKIGDQRVGVHVLVVSGTIKGVYRKLGKVRR